jgi:hypothetical protein
MRRTTSFLLLTILLCGTQLSFSAESDTCIDVHTEGDELVWDIYVHSDDYKDYLENFFRIEKGDWDGGWGWASSDFNKEFPKMWNATHMLHLIDHTRTGRWKVDSIPDASISIPFPLLTMGGGLPSRPTISVAADRKVHAFVRTGNGYLMHYHYDTAELQPDPLNFENITVGSANPGGRNLGFTGSPVVVSNPGDPLRVVGLSGVTPGNIVLFRQTSASNLGNWAAEVLTPAGASSFQVGYSVLVNGDDGILRVLGVNPNGRLIHYLVGASGLNAVAMVTPPGAQDWRVSGAEGALVAESSGERVDVFVPSRGGHLLHYWVGASGQWSAEDVTDEVDPSHTIDSNTRLAVLKPAQERYDVFARNQRGEVIRYFRGRKVVCLLGLGCIPFGYVWKSENVSNLATLVSEPPIGVTWSLDTDITSGPYAGLWPDGREAVFGLGRGLFYSTDDDYVKYYYQGSDRQWKKTDLTMMVSRGGATRNGMKVTTAPEVLMSSDGMRLYGINPAGELVEYHCSTDDWHCTVSFPGSSRTNKLLTSQPGAVEAQNGELNVLAIQQNGSWLMHHGFRSDHSWHAAVDYVRQCSGDWYGFNYEPKNETSAERVAEYVCYYAVFYSARWVNMWCGSFDEYTDPAIRAGIMVHEATRNYNSNVFCVGGSHDDDVKDWFHLHGLSEYAPGAMFLGHDHSSFQLEIEYLADLSQFPYDIVPLIIRSSAEVTANKLLRDRINHEVGWSVGIPRPL